MLEDAGGHPFMMSLAILGGLWAFPNPLLGCLLGPILLSLLSALGTLHTELMGGGSFLPTPARDAVGGGGGGGGGGASAAAAAGRLPSPWQRQQEEGYGPRGRQPPAADETRNTPRQGADAAAEDSDDEHSAHSVSLGGALGAGPAAAAAAAGGDLLDDDEADSFTFPRRRVGAKR